MTSDPLSATFQALADPTRRAILSRLARGEASMGELAKPFAMSGPAISKHLKVLERAGLIEQGRDAQFRPRRLRAEPLRVLSDWLDAYRQHWETKLDHLDGYLKEINKETGMTGDLKQKAESALELTIERVFDAPRQQVFECWTDGAHLKRWCCPKDMTISFSEGDIRPGGSFKTCMKQTDGTEHWLAGIYREIVPPELISFSHTWLDDAGNPQHETVVTIRLEDQGGKTKLKLHQAFFQSEGARDGHRGGWKETLDSLEEYLAK